MILVIGLFDEPVIEHFLSYLIINKIEYLYLDERDYGKKYFISYELQGMQIYGEIDFLTWKVSLNDISSVYQRLGMLKSYEDKESIQRYEALTNFLNVFPKKVVNKPIHSHSNSSKAHQYLSIIESGLCVPDTVISRQKDIIKMLPNSHCIVTKSISGHRSHVKTINANSIPENYSFYHQYQKELKGFNIRTHVIGDTLIPIELKTPYLDYRYAMSNGHRLSFNVIELPQHVKIACLKLMNILNLNFAGIDLFFDETDNKYYCFEINTYPGYTWYEENSSYPITKVLVDYLMF